MKQDVILVGALDFPHTPQAGDTVKNRYLLEFFKAKFRRVGYIDTMKWRRNPFVILKILYMLFFRNVEYVVISISNATAYKLISFISRFRFGKDFYYFMIGGNMPLLIKNGTYEAAPFRCLKKIVVEADGVARSWSEIGFDNTIRAYNFKPFSYIPTEPFEPKGRVKFIFLSRLMERKGIFHITESARRLNEAGFADAFEVDFYGTIQADIQSRFLNEVERLPNVSYKGFLNLKEEANYSILSEYDAMLFPTMYETEGFPGVIADAAIAGLPVIAADWNYAEELIGDGVCGYLFPTGDREALQGKMQYVIEHRMDVAQLRAHCLEKAQCYNIKNVLTDDLLHRLEMK